MHAMPVFGLEGENWCTCLETAKQGENMQSPHSWEVGIKPSNLEMCGKQVKTFSGYTRFVMDPESIPKTLGVNWEYNLDATSVHHIDKIQSDVFR